MGIDHERRPRRFGSGDPGLAEASSRRGMRRYPDSVASLAVASSSAVSSLVQLKIRLTATRFRVLPLWTGAGAEALMSHTAPPRMLNNGTMGP